MPFHFADQLAAAVLARRNPVCVGLDPQWDQLPPPIRQGIADNDLVAQAGVYRQFCCGMIDVVCDLVPIVKPQAAFFEQLGSPGMAALTDVIAYARQRGLLVLLDAKRNDVGSTAVAYARGWMGVQSAWKADALTVSPYLGEDSLQPFVDVASERGAGVFVLVKTSNPGGGMLQDVTTNGRALYELVGDLVERLAKQTQGQSGYGLVGAVTGATYPQQLAELRRAMPHAWLLAPGFGSQGGSAADVAAGFDERGLGAIVNNSRGINFAYARAPYAEEFGASRWERATEQATRDMIDALAAVIGEVTRDI